MSYDNQQLIVPVCNAIYALKTVQILFFLHPSLHLFSFSLLSPPLDNVFLTPSPRSIPLIISLVLSFSLFLSLTRVISLLQPMPPKHVLKRLDKFDSFFLESRRVGLQRFLARIAHHPLLSLDKSFMYVFTSVPLSPPRPTPHPIDNVLVLVHLFTLYFLCLFLVCAG